MSSKTAIYSYLCRQQDHCWQGSDVQGYASSSPPSCQGWSCTAQPLCGQAAALPSWRQNNGRTCPGYRSPTPTLQVSGQVECAASAEALITTLFSSCREKCGCTVRTEPSPPSFGDQDICEHAARVEAVLGQFLGSPVHGSWRQMPLGSCPAPPNPGQQPYCPERREG